MFVNVCAWHSGINPWLYINWLCNHKPVIPELRRWHQENKELKVTLFYIVNPRPALETKLGKKGRRNGEREIILSVSWWTVATDLFYNPTMARQPTECVLDLRLHRAVCAPKGNQTRVISRVYLRKGKDLSRKSMQYHQVRGGAMEDNNLSLGSHLIREWCRLESSPVFN